MSLGSHNKLPELTIKYETSQSYSHIHKQQAFGINT